MKVGRFLLVGWAALFAATAYGADYVDPSRVLVVYHSGFSDYDFDGIPDSEAVAWYYVVRRGVPTSNLLAVQCSLVDGNNRYYYYSNEWATFYTEVFLPIQQKLNSFASPQDIDYIVLCYGVPYRLGINLTGDPADDFDVSVAASVADVFNVGDAATPASDFDPGLANPFFLNADPTSSAGPHFDHSGALADKYLATSLEGDEPVVIFDMVEGCIYGDKFMQNAAGSYRGKVYIEQYNTSGAASPYPSTAGAVWDKASQEMNTLQTWIDTFWPYDCERGVGIVGGPWSYIDYTQDPPVTVTIPLGEWETTGESGGGPSDTAPDAMFYGGWHHGSFDYRDVFGWLPGSAAAHLQNGPANDRLRGPFTDPLASDAWCTQALARGLSAALGRCSWTRAPGQIEYFVEEFRPEIFVYYMTHGYNFAESCYASMEYMKCLDLPVGDPIYCPLLAGKPALDDVASLPPRLLVGDGPQANSKMVSISAGTMAGDHTTVPTEMYLFRLDVGTAKDSLQTLYDYDDCARYSIYQRYIVTQMADATPLQSGQIYWLKAYAKDPSGNVWESPFTAFAGEGPITDPTVSLDTALSPTDVLDRYLNPSDPDAAIWGNNINPMWISDSGDGRAVYKFNLPAAVPKDALIIKAALNVYWNFRTVAGGTDPTICNVFGMQRAWNEAEVNWLQADAGQDWARQGVSCGGIDSATYALHAMERSYYPVSIPYFEGAGIYDPDGDPFVQKEIDITGIVNEWIAETTPNYGVMLDNPAQPDDSNLAFSTEGVAGSSPSLDIYWKCEPPMVTLTADPQESGRASSTHTFLGIPVKPPYAKHSSGGMDDQVL